MYEASFGLKRRPFAATPDATCFLSSEPIRAALDEIVVCVEQGQGIAVLTAPAGTGKTLLCERLRCELDQRFETVFLRHASFLTRRALLQTVLCELNAPYHHPSEQELRLELLPTIRALQPKREALVLICDEAHLLPDSLLEELRILADFAESGRPLVRLVLVGQLSLEEKLAQPGLDAFNQRIRAHVSLSSFDHAASLDYIDYRLTWSGGRIDEIFTPQAIELIAQVSDGIPRCINQLADHTLLLAFVAEQRPAGDGLVREALSDLRQLPLHWNEPLQSLSPASGDFDAFAPDESQLELSEPELYETEATDTDLKTEGARSFETSNSFSFEDHLALADAIPQEVNVVDINSDDWRQTLDLFTSSLSSADFADSYSRNMAKDSNDPVNAIIDGSNAGSTSDEESSGKNSEAHFIVEPASSSTTSSSSSLNEAEASHIPATRVNNSVSEFEEEIIVDRYAAIDAGFEPPAHTPLDTTQRDQVHSGYFPLDPPQLIPQSMIVDSPRFDAFLSSNDVFEETHEIEATSSEGVFLIQANEPAAVHGQTRTTQNESTTGPVEEVDALEVVADMSSESLIQAIRDEVNDLASSVERHKLDASILTGVGESAWESIESPARPSQPHSEARPFRYLFSKLRRKQQGLS